jgi:hypothetical protein
MCCRAVDYVVNGAQRDPRTYIKLTGENNINGTDQFFLRPNFHPITRGPGTQGAFCINLFRLSRYGENPHPPETRRELLDEKNSVAIAKKRFNQEKVGPMPFQQFTRGPLISCQPAHRKTEVPADDRSQPFPRDGAIVGDNDARSSRGDRVANRSHNFGTTAWAISEMAKQASINAIGSKAHSLNFLFVKLPSFNLTNFMTIFSFSQWLTKRQQV